MIGMSIGRTLHSPSTVVRHYGRRFSKSVLIASAAFVGLVVTATPGQAETAFDSYLAQGYGEVAWFAGARLDNPEAAKLFKSRADEAAQGETVLPATIDSTSVIPDAMRAEAIEAHSDLMAALDEGLRESDPQIAAVAQVNYDCWVAQFPSVAGMPDSNDCRTLFYQAMADAGVPIGTSDASSAAISGEADRPQFAAVPPIDCGTLVPCTNPLTTATQVGALDADDNDPGVDDGDGDGTDPGNDDGDDGDGDDGGNAGNDDDDDGSNGGGNNSGGSLIGIGIGSGDGTGNGSLVGIGIATGDDSANGGLIGAGVGTGDDSANGGLVGISAFGGENTGRGGLVGAAIASGEDSGQGGLVSVSALSDDGLLAEAIAAGFVAKVTDADDSVVATLATEETSILDISIGTSSATTGATSTESDSAETGTSDGLGSATSNGGTGLGGAASSVGSGLGGAVSDAGDGIGGAVSNAGGSLGGGVADAGDALGGGASGLGNGLGGAVSDVSAGLGGAVSNVGGAVGGALGGDGGGLGGLESGGRLSN